MSTQIVMPSQLAARRNMCVTLTRMVEDKVHESRIHVAGRPRLDRRLPVFDQSAECSRVGAIKNHGTRGFLQHRCPRPGGSSIAGDRRNRSARGCAAGCQISRVAPTLRTAHGYGPEGSKPTASSSHRRHIRGRGVLRMANGCTGDRVDGGFSAPQPTRAIFSASLLEEGNRFSGAGSYVTIDYAEQPGRRSGLCKSTTGCRASASLWCPSPLCRRRSLTRIARKRWCADMAYRHISSICQINFGVTRITCWSSTRWRNCGPADSMLWSQLRGAQWIPASGTLPIGGAENCRLRIEVTVSSAGNDPKR